MELSQGITLIYLTYFHLLCYNSVYILFTLPFLRELFIVNRSIKHRPWMKLISKLVKTAIAVFLSLNFDVDDWSTL